MLLSLLFVLATAACFASANGDGASAYAAAGPSSENTTIYEVLPLYGLPPGIFPDTVTDYSLSEDGALTVNLSGTCYVEFDYTLYYETTITGVLKYGSLYDIKGIQSRKFLIWFDVVRIKVDLPPTSYIYFDIGWISRKFDVDQFQTVHSCKSNTNTGRTFKRSFEWTEDFFTNLLW